MVCAFPARFLFRNIPTAKGKAVVVEPFWFRSINAETKCIYRWMPKDVTVIGSLERYGFRG
jgi:hypothetical protein